MSDEELHARLVAWVAKEFGRQAHRACISLELSNAPPGGRGIPIRTWDRTEHPELFGNLSTTEQLVTEILSLADAWTADYGGKQRYELRTKQHLGGSERTSFTMFSSDGSGEQGDQEGPTPTGLVAMLMRHNEVKERTMTQMFQASLGTLSRTVQDLAEENRELRKDRNAALRELEKQASQEAERDLAIMAKSAEIDRKDKAFQKIMQLAPVVASKFLTGGEDGSKGLPAALSLLLTELADSLTNEQIQRITASLHPSQGMLLAQAIELARRQKAENDAKESPAGEEAKAAS